MAIIKIEFEITSIPNESQKQYFAAYLEGIIKICLDEKLFFCSADFLIAEFGISLKKWVDKIKIGELSDFYFETMDSDETPILAFRCDGGSGFVPEAVWQEFESKDTIDKINLLEGIESFLKKLDVELNKKCNTGLEELGS